MQKTITVTLYFDDDFTPPEKFEEATRSNHYNSKCERCPFFGWDDETADSWCNLPDVYRKDDECPIKKYFD